jgi:hypothetical protein
MPTAMKMTLIDPEGEREQLAAGGAIVNRYGAGLVQITFLSLRHDAQAAVDGRPHVLPQLVIIGRYILDNEGAENLANNLREVVANSRSLSARVLSEEQGGTA